MYFPQFFMLFWWYKRTVFWDIWEKLEKSKMKCDLTCSDPLKAVLLASSCCCWVLTACCCWVGWGWLFCCCWLFLFCFCFLFWLFLNPGKFENCSLTVMVGGTGVEGRLRGVVGGGLFFGLGALVVTSCTGRAWRLLKGACGWKAKHWAMCRLRCDVF